PVRDDRQEPGQHLAPVRVVGVPAPPRSDERFLDDVVTIGGRRPTCPGPAHLRGIRRHTESKDGRWAVRQKPLVQRSPPPPLPPPPRWSSYQVYAGLASSGLVTVGTAAHRRP